MKFGLIPEFVGRLPIVVTLESLDHSALISILSKPKNALVKQYKKLFEYDNVELEFDEEALRAIADEAIKRSTGARGLRAIIEDTMTNIMYEIPSRDDIAKVVITKESIISKEEPTIIIGESKIKEAKSKKLKKGKDVETA